VGVERLGIALEPAVDYEMRPDGGGGCEDPRVTFIEPLQRYIMSYTAFSPRGPRIAPAASEDLLHWKRLGLAKFAPANGVAFDEVNDKDASFFPVAIPNPSGQPELALFHRPLFLGTRPEETVCLNVQRDVDVDRESIWISYSPAGLLDTAGGVSPAHVQQFTSHHRLATRVSPWKRLKIGAGTPPILTRHGWLILYHGVSEVEQSKSVGYHLCYSAGVMLLSKEHPQVVLYRSAQPVLTPLLPQERQGTIANVVFPTGNDRRDDLSSPDRFDIYYGMADNRIGVARLDLPEHMPLVSGSTFVRQISPRITIGCWTPLHERPALSPAAPSQQALPAFLAESRLHKAN